MKIIYAAAFWFATLAHADETSPPTLPSTNENAMNQSKLAHPDVTRFSILPSATDPAIKTFDDPHWLYVNRDIVVDQKPELPKDRHQLLLWITGTGGKGHDAVAFCSLAADLGYHAVTLMYPDDIPASACANDANPKSFENFRLAIIQGGHATYQVGRKNISIDQPESIENRLIKLLLFLKAKRPKENWDQFLNNDGTVKWETIAVAGQSQGGGHAALIGIKHQVARVLCFGSPKDFSKRLHAPAAFYREESATPKDRFFTFNHLQDPVGCTQQQLSKNMKALELDTFGPPVDVTTEDAPYHHTRILTTSFPVVTETSESMTPDGKNSEWARTAHTSVIADKYADRWKQVWTYLLTEKTP
ncbi:MAG TPA: hypothetical protein VNV14_05475 [Opitutaceae bacterium]|nr:hypothetical protein [Opitutaceae bacterium]